MKTESQIVKDWMRTMELEDFKKDIKKVNNKFFKLYGEAMREE